jgi:G3E family GTPase
MPASALTPVTVLTGFLGSGKSTLANRMVADRRYRDTAIVVNEWGEVPIDHALVREGGENVVVLPSGCVCCRVAGDLVNALRDLHSRRAAGSIPPFTRVAIETSGLADPAPLLATLIELPLVAARFALSGVVTTVDAEFGVATLDEHPEAVKQAAIADRLVVTKVDRADPVVVAALEERLRSLNPGARTLRSTRGDADPSILFDAGLYRGPDRTMDAAGWLNAGAYRNVGEARTTRHDPRIASFAWRHDEPAPWEDVEAALEAILDASGERILRMKGLVAVASEPGPRAVHAVQHALYPSARLAAWPGDDRSTRVVFIVRDLEESRIAHILESFLRSSASVPR